MTNISMAGPWITEHEEKIVLDALRNGWYGKQAYYYVETFETEFARYHDRKHALMTPNCTTALHLLLAGLNIGEGDEVIAPECTWIGSTACITYQRARPVFADIDAATLVPDGGQHRTRDHAANQGSYRCRSLWQYAGLETPFVELCEKRDIVAIEDAAEALGSTYKGVRAGKFGIGSTFSFHRTKTLTTGEGGMLLIDDDALFERCKFLRDHGRAPGTYFNTEVTFKYMPFNLQAALGYAQFQRLDELVGKKRWIWNGYRERLADIPDWRSIPKPMTFITACGTRLWCSENRTA